MTPLLQSFANVVKGVICGFDRIVFKGYILPLMHKDGATRFLSRNGVLNKDYKDWVTQQTQHIVEPAGNR